MTQHTPEPWDVRKHAYEAGHRITNSIRSTIAVLEFRDEDEANARRIVACVNACAGIPTEALEIVARRFPTDQDATLRYLRDLISETLKP